MRDIDPQGRIGLHRLMQAKRQLAGAAAQIKASHAGLRLEHRDQVEARLEALTFEALVLLDVPIPAVHADMLSAHGEATGVGVSGCQGVVVWCRGVRVSGRRSRSCERL